MATGGITFGAAKGSLRLAADNGLPDSDPRVMRRTNEATQELLAELIPVNGMMTVDIAIGADNFFLLPKEMENAIAVEAVSSTTRVNGSADVNQGWYSIVNSFTYVDPSMQHDNPLVDYFLVPLENDPTVLVRRYYYPGIAPSSVIRVTGAKRYLPITSDDDYLIIQNVPALKLMVMGIERREARNSVKEGSEYKAEAVALLQSEVKKHLMDPTRTLRRKANYQSDIVTYEAGTLGNVRARLALEVPDYLMIGKSDISYFVNEAVREAVDHYNFLGRTERYSADEGPNQITYTLADEATDVLAYPNFEVIRLLVIAQRTPPPAVVPPQDSTPARAQAFSLIERNLATAVEAARTAAHLAATKTFAQGTKGWMVGRIGLELPEALMYPVSRLNAIVDRAEERGINMGVFKGMLEEFDAHVVCGNVLFPERVESVLAASLDGEPLDVRSIFFKYLKNGPGAWDYSCSGRLDDQGDVTLKDGVRRRRYTMLSETTRIAAASTTSSDSGSIGAGTILDGFFYLNSDSRIVPIEGGAALENKDESGNWIRQSEWTEL